MSSQDVELMQNFVRKYVNRAVKEHFSDIDGNDDASLSLDVPRQAIKRVCLHKDTDPIVLTVIRLLFWWIEAKGLFNDIIYGIPSTEFDIKYKYYPQVKLHFKENRYESSTNNRKPVRSEITFRWRSEDFTTQNINALATKIHADFAKPVFFYAKGRQCWTYWDDRKGYRFTVYVQSEVEAKKIIEQITRIQDEVEPDWQKNLRFHADKQNYTTRETIRVMGDTYVKPRKRPVGTVRYEYAELFIHGMKKPIILSDATSYRPQALKYA